LSRQWSFGSCWIEDPLCGFLRPFAERPYHSPLPSIGSWSFQVRLHHGDDFVGGRELFRTGLLLFIEDVTLDMAVQELGHQTVHGPSCGTHQLQNVGAITFFGESPHKSFHLSLNALGPEKQFLLIFDRMAHGFRFFSTILYPVWYIKW